MRVDTVEAERDRAVKRARAERDKEKARADAAEEKAANAEQIAKEAISKRPPVKMQIENAWLKKRVERIEGWLQQLISIIPDPFRAFIRNVLSDKEPFNQEKDKNRQRGKDSQREL